MSAKRDEFVCGYAAAIADLFRLEGGSNIRMGELLSTLGGIRAVKGKGVCREDMNILRQVARMESVD